MGASATSRVAKDEVISWGFHLESRQSRDSGVDDGGVVSKTLASLDRICLSCAADTVAADND